MLQNMKIYKHLGVSHAEDTSVFCKPSFVLKLAANPFSTFSLSFKLLNHSSNIVGTPSSGIGESLQLG